jgi:transcriptional regulator with XRE-family HTH domain
MPHVGQEIRQRRNEKGWSQAKLGVLSGTGPSGISQIETGRRNPSAATIQRIADALDVEVAELFPKEQSPLPSPAVAEMDATLSAIRENLATLEEYFENPPDEPTADEAMERFYDLGAKPLEIMTRMTTREIRLYIADVRNVFDAYIRISRQLEAWNEAQYGHRHRDVG